MTAAALSHTVTLSCQDDVATARRLARSIALELGFDAFAATAVTTATSELARNVVVHGGGGFMGVEMVRDAGRVGLALTFHDEGPGIENLERALQGGYSTRRSLGLGLSGSRRLVDSFDIDTAPGAGTRIRIVKWKRR